MQFKEGDPVILTNLKYAGRDSHDIADVVIFPSGAKLALFESYFGLSNLVSSSALDEIERLQEALVEIVYQIGQGNNMAAMDIAAPIAAAYIQQKGE